MPREICGHRDPARSIELVCVAEPGHAGPHELGARGRFHPLPDGMDAHEAVARLLAAGKITAETAGQLHADLDLYGNAFLGGDGERIDPATVTLR